MLKRLALALIVVGLTTQSSIPSYAGQFQQNHPRRAQVLGRANNQQRRLNRNYGNLGGHYKQLSKEDRGIKRQEQRDARNNNGHITTGEQTQLNKEENHVNRQINRDKQ